MIRRFCWQLYGFVFYRPWNAIRDRLGRGRLFTELRAWCWRGPPGKPFIECRFRHWLHELLCVRHISCPHCGYADWRTHHDLFNCTASGSGFDGEYTHHWFRGDQQCFRCGIINEYGDSSP